MRYLRSATLVVALFFFFNCSNKEELSQTSLELEKSIVTVLHGDHLISNRPSFSKLIGKDSIIYFESSERIFYLFDLKNQSTSEFLRFNQEGPNFIEEIILDFDLYEDNFVILSPNYLHVSDRQSRITNRIPINQFKEDFRSAEYRIHRIQTLPDNTILLSKWIKSAIYPNTIDDPSTSIFAELSMSNEEIIDLPVYSPEEALTRDPNVSYLGDSEHYFFAKECDIIFNFKFSSSIFVYNKCSDKLVKYASLSNNLPNLKEPIESKLRRDPRAMTEFITNGVSYSNIGFIEKHHTYARLVSMYSTNDNNNARVDKYLQLLNSKFEVLKEERLNEIVLDKIHVESNHIYLKSLQTEENSTRFLKFSLH